MCLKTECRKNGTWSGDSCKLESRKQKRQECILSYHPFRSECITQLSGGVVICSLEFLCWDRSSEPFKIYLINNLPSAFSFSLLFWFFLVTIFSFPFEAKQAEVVTSLSVWDQVSERMLPGSDRAGFNSHLFLGKLMYMSPGRRARDLNSELPEVGFSFPPSEFLLCKEELKLEGHGQRRTCGPLA